MNIDLTSGLLDAAIFRASPNADDRPENTEISLIVIHGISLPAGVFGTPYVDELFLNRLSPLEHPSFGSLIELRVSAHVFIRRTGLTIQYVPLHRRAWHAGVSCFEGQERCNDFSIGIELEGTDTVPYTEDQYRVLETLIVSLQQAYPAILPHRVVGHKDIAPGRKTDPGPVFNWARLRAVLA